VRSVAAIDTKAACVPRFHRSPSSRRMRCGSKPTLASPPSSPAGTTTGGIAGESTRRATARLSSVTTSSSIVRSTYARKAAYVGGCSGSGTPNAVVDRADAADDGPPLLRVPEDHGQRRVDRAPQAIEGAPGEVAVVGDAGRDERMRDPHQQRAAAAEEQDRLAVDAPRERPRTEQPRVARPAGARVREAADHAAQGLHAPHRRDATPE
jgi:hypothetical protein